jgi:lysophospholipid acyltransferase (LPLAT)-like uncharacterized protein
LKKRLRNWLIIQTGTVVLRVWFATCRVRVIGGDIFDRIVSNREPAVAATWHRGAGFLIWYFRRARPMILFSRSNDGELISGFAENLGIVPVRGSSSQGGGQALRTMLKFLRGNGSRLVATVMDGPQGPRFRAKKGLLFLSRMAGVPLVPIAVSAWPALTLKNAWDRTIIPLPFSCVTVMYGNPIQVPKNTDDRGLNALTGKVEARLNAMMGELDRQTGYIRKWPEVYGVDTHPAERKE